MSAWGRAHCHGRYRAALAEACASEDPYAVSVHIPYCRWRCWYCACDPQIRSSTVEAESFIDALTREAWTVGDVLGPRPVGWLRLGGGSPGFLEPHQLQRLMGTLRDTLTITPETRISIELDAWSATPDIISTLADVGATDLILGVQDLDAAVGRAIGRVVSGPRVANLVVAARAARFRRVEVDVMYGLPSQTPSSLGFTLDRIALMDPDAVRTFRYVHLPEQYPRQGLLERSGLPGPEATAHLAHSALSHLVEMGHEPREPGYMSRDNDGWAEGHPRETDRIGLGPGAYGALWSAERPVCVRNAINMTGYRAALSGIAVEICHQLTPEEHRRWRALRQILSGDQVDLGSDRAPWPGFEQAYERMAPLEADGLVQMGAGGLTLTGAGRFFRRAIASRFDVPHGGWARDFHEAAGSASG